MSHDSGGGRGRRLALLLDQVVSERESGAEILAAMSRAILREVRYGFEGEIGIGYEIAQRQE